MTEEQNWIKKAQVGDREAFRKLVEIYQRQLFAFAYDLTGNFQDAEDLSQEVFLKMWRKLDTFRIEAKLSSWLYRIAMNTFIDRSRSKNARVHKMKDDLEDRKLAKADYRDGEPFMNPEAQTEANWMQEQVKRALDALTPKERIIFTLRHYQDLKMSDISDRLGVTTGTVKSLLFRATKKLQKELAFIKEHTG